jgi:hypothetical protein
MLLRKLLNHWIRGMTMSKTDCCICIYCKWRDAYNAQCYDGHLQMPNKKECEGYEHSIVSAKFMFEVQESKK